MNNKKIIFIKDLKKKKEVKAAIKEVALLVAGAGVVYGVMFLYALIAWCI